MRASSVLAAVATAAWLSACVSLTDIEARRALRGGDIDRAEALAESALAADPDDAAARRLAADIATQRGVEALEHGRMDKARGYFQKAVELDPGDETAQKYRALVDKDLRNRIDD
jgi:tetratricopeptide (TPR) repeat protein